MISLFGRVFEQVIEQTNSETHIAAKLLVLYIDNLGVPINTENNEMNTRLH